MRYEMQCWSSREKRWQPMQEGAAGHVWKPRGTAIEAAAKCLAWTGGIAPAMQVVDTLNGDVVWRDPMGYLGCGERIELPEEHLVKQEAKRILTGDDPPPTRAQESLF